MKSYLKKIISFFNKIFFIFNNFNLNVSTNFFYLVAIKSDKNNCFILKYSSFYKSRIIVSGDNNTLNINKALVSGASISLSGNNNKVCIEEGVKLRNATLIVRGNNCSIYIGKNSTFGGVRMVSVGSDCEISIGHGCMFSDNIELWASDTHPIYNNNFEIINHEAPINIGDRVWVGARVIILKGVSIGNGSVIGMGTTVTKNIPENVVSVGCPNYTVRTNITWELDTREGNGKN